MEYPENGAPILHGEGVAAVRKKIEAAFRDARTKTHAGTSGKRMEMVKEVEVGISIAPTTPLPTPLRPLAERAKPIFRACERRLRHSAKRHSAVHYISVPTQSADRLYEEALRFL